MIKNRDTWILSPDHQEKENLNFLKLFEDESIFEPINLKCKTLILEESINKDENIGLFNKKLLEFPLVLRKWEDGDKIQPLGMKGSKKVSDILIDKKISINEKKNIYVILSKGEIIWLLGHVISEKYKVISKNKQVYEMILKA